MELAIPCRAGRTLGEIIAEPDSSDLIDGVRIEPLQVHPDDRGFFMELARLGKGLATQMVPEGDRRIQVSFTLTYPGTIQAIHYHSEQTDLWAPVSGMVQVFLYDFRRNSKSFGCTNTNYVGKFRPWEILIPLGVGHGYKALGVEPTQLLYFTDRHYNPADELRIAYNDPAIAYDWETQRKEAMRILLIGASGMLGKDLVQEWTAGELIPASSREADIRDLTQVRNLVDAHRPDWIILAAAYTDVDGSERAPETAYGVNHKGTANVARVAGEYNAHVFYVSTDYVFDGRADRPYEPDHPIAPLNVYDDSKAKGEAAVCEFAPGWCIARTSWLFGSQGSSFPEKILKAAECKPELQVVLDQIGCPTFTRDLAFAIQQLIISEARGTLNVTNAGCCSWFDFAKEILRQAGRATRVSPITTAEAGRLAKRPRYSVLSPASLNAYGIYMRSWQESVTAYLAELRHLRKLA